MTLGQLEEICEDCVYIEDINGNKIYRSDWDAELLFGQLVDWIKTKDNALVVSIAVSVDTLADMQSQL